jgi:4a-hydroxytetrahydrobiopterin dehydratase
MAKTSAANLAAKSCKTTKASRLDATATVVFLKQIPGWVRKGGEISKTFPFSNYYETMAFVNATAWISNREDHHPDMEVGYNKCKVRYSTHSVGGLSENDFICAAKIESLFKL